MKFEFFGCIDFSLFNILKEKSFILTGTRVCNMPDTQKRKLTEKRKSKVVDMENQNSNHASAESNKSKSLKLDQKLKPNKVETSVKATFNEDDEAEGNITSDGEIDSELDYSNDGLDKSEAEEEGEGDFRPEDAVDTEEVNSEREGGHDNSTIDKRGKKSREETVEEKLDSLSSSLKIMQDLMLKRGLCEDSQNKKYKKDKGRSSHSIQFDEQSDMTIYHNTVAKALPNENEKEEIVVDQDISFKVNNKRDSSSSEDRIDTSDELMDMEDNSPNAYRANIDPDKFIADCVEKARRSNDNDTRDKQEGGRPSFVEESEKVIREAEAAKVRLYGTPGRGQCHKNAINWPVPMPVGGEFAALVDENYLVIGSHVDRILQLKIASNEYVDFARLIPKNRQSFSRHEDHRMELVSKGGFTYFVPVSDRESALIHNFGKWEQAFRVFSNIYTRAHPHRASELVQYNHIIYTASCTFVWDNVYTYDHEFRMHLANFPNRSWAVILQQGWSMYLKDKINREDISKHSLSFNGNSRGKSNEICERYNRGKCTNGASCKYLHKCKECGKFGHGQHICRKCKHNNGASTSMNSQAKK